MRFLVSVVCLFVALSAFAGPIEDFEAAIQSEDIDTRFNAAMNSGDLGAQALPIAIKYWDAESDGARKAARVALPVIVRAVQQPEKESERSAACDILIEAAKNGGTDQLRREALFRLGSIAGGSHVGAIAALLEDVAVQEQAAQALENIPGSEATQALINALDDAAPGFRVQLMFALSGRKAYEAIPAIRTHARSSDDRARWGAIESLARLGMVPAQVAPLPRNASQDDRLRYLNATLDAAVALEEKGEAKKAEQVYLAVLSNAGMTDHIVAFGLNGLARVESQRLAEQAIAYLGMPGPHASAMQTLIDSQEPKMNEALVRAFSNVDAGIQCAILRILNKRDQASLERAIASVENPAPAVAYEIARLKGEPRDNVDTLIELGWRGPFFLRDDVIADANAAAAGLPAEDAGKVYAALASEKFPEPVRLDAIAALGGNEGGASVLDGLAGNGPESIRSAAQRALIANAAKFKSADEAETTILAILQNRVNASIIDTAANTLNAIGKSPAAIGKSLGYLAQWRLLGPLTADQAAAAEAGILAGEAITAEGMPEWKEATIDPWPPIVNLRSHYARHRNMIAYARYAPASGEIAPGKYTLAVGSDDGCVVFVNGEAVISKPEARSWVADQDKVSITITDPKTSIVLKVMQGDADWMFSARLIPEK